MILFLVIINYMKKNIGLYLPRKQSNKILIQ